VLTNGNVQLADILYNETAFFYFMEVCIALTIVTFTKIFVRDSLHSLQFMELENKRELLDFWMSAISYKQNLLEKKGAADPEEAQSDAVIIYEK